MSAATDYLEAAKIDDVVRQMQDEGFEVTRATHIDGKIYDLVGEKLGRRIAVEVRARSRLSATGEPVAERREKAFEHGFNEFRLFVVNPPHETAVKIEGLEQQLREYMGEHHPTELVDDLGLSVRVDDVSQVDLDAITITAQGIHLIGDGVVDVEVDDGDGEDDSGPWLTDFPFTFDLLLDHGLRIVEVNRITVNTSHYYRDNEVDTPYDVPDQADEVALQG